MERVKVTQEQADVLFEIARMSKGIPAKTLISALENGFDIESEAEAKKRRWWEKHNRGVWELKEKDLLKENDSDHIAEVKKVKDNRFIIGDTTVYPVYENLDFVQKHYRVACFVEDRKDV